MCVSVSVCVLVCVASVQCVLSISVGATICSIVNEACIVLYECVN